MTVRVSVGARGAEAHLAPALFYASAREGVKDMPADTPFAEGGILLLVLIGWSARERSGAYDPVRELEIRANLYNFNADGSVGVASMEAELCSACCRVAVAVVLHYFGGTEPVFSNVCELMCGRGALTVEDMARGSASAQHSPAAGKLADVRPYSLHTTFAFCDGVLVAYVSSRLINGQCETSSDVVGQSLSYNWATIRRTRNDNFSRLMNFLSGFRGYDESSRPLWKLAQRSRPESLRVRSIEGVREAIYHEMKRDRFGMVNLYDNSSEEFRTWKCSRSIIIFRVRPGRRPRRAKLNGPVIRRPSCRATSTKVNRERHLR